MKKIKILIFIMMLLFPRYVCASDVFSLADFVYYDPVSTMSCSDKNYWTIYNQNTTCYRFIVLENNDTASSKILRVMLDHDVGIGKFDDYKTILANGTSSWKRYDGIVDIIDEDTIYELMKLSKKPTLEDISVNGGISLSFFKTNTMYKLNGRLYNDYGYWSKDIYELNQEYVYTVTEYGNNRLVSRTNNRGVRPVIVLDKTLLTKASKVTNIDSLIKNSSEYKYVHSSEKYDNYMYKQLQGFTFTKDKLVFHSSNNNAPDNGLISVYGGNEFNNLYKHEYGSTAHGNDMTYNSNTNKVLVLVKKEIYEYNGDTITYEKKYTSDDMGGFSYISIGYDDVHNHYYVLSSGIVYVLDSGFKQWYSVDVTSLGVYQGLEYHNGYLYVTTFEDKCPNNYQLYCFMDRWSSITYVYNVKFNKNGTPSDDFGRLVDRLYVGSGIGELESISFHNENMYLGYASYSVDSTYSYKFYGIPYSKVAYQPDYSVKYDDNGDSKTITISSKEELKLINGWSVSDDLHSLSKTVDVDTASTVIDVCDLYNNCAKVYLKELVFDNNDSNLNGDNKENVLTNPKTGQRNFLVLIMLIFSIIVMRKYYKKIF